MTCTFKAGTIHYEVFIKNEYYEIYELNNPKEGLIFDSKKQLISFINHITDIIEEGAK